MTSNKLKGSVWVKLLVERKSYMNFAEINPARIKSHILVLKTYFLEDILPSLKSTRLEKRALKIKGRFNSTSNRYLLTE